MNTSVRRSKGERTTVPVNALVLEQLHRDASLGKMASGSVHDVGNLLRGALGLLEMVSSGLEGEQKHMVMAAAKAMATAQTFTKSFLGYAKGGALKDEDKSVRVGEVAEEVAGLLRTVYTSSVTINICNECEGVSIFGLRSNLEQILHNLIGNAVQACERGKGVITVTARKVARKENPGGLMVSPSYVELIVEDNGKGMSEETLKRVCEPFFSTRTESGGHGLGLVVVMSLASHFGGKVKIGSVLGRGTRVDVLLPVYEVGDESVGSFF